MASWWSRITGRPSSIETEERGLFARTDGNLLVNDPAATVWLGSDSLYSLFGRPTAAEGLAVTTRATSLITGPLTAAPYVLVDDETGARLPTPRWVADPMLLRSDLRLLPDGLQAFPHARRLTRSRFWGEVIRSCVWYGQGAFLHRISGTGEPVAGTMRVVNPSVLQVSPEGNWIIGTYPQAIELDREGNVTVGGQTYHLSVMRNPLSPVGDDGLSKGVFGLSEQAFTTAATVDNYTAGTFKSGVPAGYLRTTNPNMTQPQADALKAAWLAAHGGDTRSIAVLSATTEFNPISFSPVDAEAVAVARMSIGQVAMAFGLPPEVLGVSLSNSSTYVNVGDSWDRLRSFGLQLWISELEDLLSSLVPFGRSLKVDLAPFEVETTPTVAPTPEPQADPAAQDPQEGDGR